VICGLYSSDTVAQTVSQVLGDFALPEAVTYALESFTAEEKFLQFVQQNRDIDCLILEKQPRLQTVLDQLSQESIYFPVVFLRDGAIESAYHAATLCLPTEQLQQIGEVIDQAIAQFIQLSPVRQPPSPQAPLTFQQRRLCEKLKEQLEHSGVYYKRNSKNFMRHMSASEREELVRHLKTEYREIVLTYFSRHSDLDDRLDHFVNLAFFADVSVAQVVEVHMELMDEFSKQLKLEGRNDDILQDYRLTLIDAIAHLGELYRRSIPRES
jgi:circadian clock protein KaiA